MGSEREVQGIALDSGKEVKTERSIEKEKYRKEKKRKGEE